MLWESPVAAGTDDQQTQGLKITLMCYLTALQVTSLPWLWHSLGVAGLCSFWGLGTLFPCLCSI